MTTDTIITANEALQKISELSRDALKANERAKRYGLKEARRERRYREGQDKAWATARLTETGLTTAKDREAWVNGQCAALREQRDVASVMAQSMRSLEYTYRQTISAYQSVLRMVGEEMNMYNHGQVPSDVPEPEMPEGF